MERIVSSSATIDVKRFENNYDKVERFKQVRGKNV